MRYVIIFYYTLVPVFGWFGSTCESSKPLEILKQENSAYAKQLKHIEKSIFLEGKAQKLLIVKDLKIKELEQTIKEYEQSIAKDIKTTDNAKSSYQTVLQTKQKKIQTLETDIEQYKTKIIQLKEKIKKNKRLSNKTAELTKKLKILEKQNTITSKSIPSNGFAKVVRGQRSYSTLKGKPSIVKDNLRGLLWQKKDDGKKKTFAEATEYCKTLRLDGIKGWRVPTMEELYYLADRKKSNPSIDTRYFKDTKMDDWYWTSTDKGSASAWIVTFYFGTDYWSSKTSTNYVRCVRQ